MDKKNFRIFYLVLCLILLCIQVYAGIKNTDSNIKFKYVAHASFLNETLAVTDENKEENKIFELREKYSNDDITGYLSIANTDISEPVLKYSNNDYYLHHNNYGNYEINGSIFQDHRISLEDRKVLIYGHSSVYDNIPFNELEKYYNKDFYNEHKYINLITENSEYTYEIFSVYVEVKDFTYMNLKISDETYNEYLKKYKSNSLYDTGVNVDPDDEIIILQTCSNDKKYEKYKKKYLLVIGKKI